MTHLQDLVTYKRAMENCLPTGVRSFLPMILYLCCVSILLKQEYAILHGVFLSFILML